MITFDLFYVLCQRRYCCWNIVIVVESELATWKIVTIMQKWQKMQAQIFQSVLSASCCFLDKNFNFFEVAWSAVDCNSVVGCIMNVWGYQHWNTANTTLDIYLFFVNSHKSTQTRCKVCSNLRKCTTTLNFRFTSAFFY